MLSPANPFDPITSTASLSLYKRYDAGAIFVKINTIARMAILILDELLILGVQFSVKAF